MSALKLGSSGLAVESLQSDLNKLIGAGLVVDGQFGAHTFKAVEDYQTNNGLTVDGIVGPLTAASIAALLGGTVIVNPPTIHYPFYIDGYHGDAFTSWTDIVNSGVVMISHKATQGAHNKDSEIAHRWPLMAQHGLMRQAYLFYNFGEGVNAQVDNYFSVVDPLWIGTDKPHELDLGEVDLQPSQQLWDEALGILQIMEKRSGKIPWVYGSEGILNQYNLPAEFARYPLCVADYSHKPPRIVSPWNGKFIAHQYSESGTVAGIGNACDLDYFNGTLDELKAL